MESSIPAHLRCPRTRPRRVDESYTPPYPAWVARSPEAVTRVVMAYIGVQSRGSDRQGVASEEFARLLAHLQGPDGPSHVDTAHELDGAGFDNRVVIAYWLDVVTYQRWQNSALFTTWWSSNDREASGVGYFMEVFSPRLKRFETLFSTPDHLEGIGKALGLRSIEDVSEHAYWGSMRERIPIAQTDELHPGGMPQPTSATTPGSRVRIDGHENLALIRSGQEWTATTGQERALYVQEIEPTLRRGMEFLRDAGAAVGCYANHYMRHTDPHGQLLEKSFGFSLWRSLRDMEQWAEAHPTHIAIFGTFMRVVQALEFNLALCLYHEVAILARDEQQYEYINCHPGTGMLGSLRSRPAAASLQDAGEPLPPPL